ncbi:MAG TPA: lysoplasmalogenase family protein [Nevskiaceae bacterium]|nr:lysoplasmalogenase family protein [Nevskiaceae bacterium]
MLTLLITAILLCAAATIAADWRQRRPPFYLLKPLTTLLLIGLLWLAPLEQGERYRLGLTLAFVFCLAGDIALMSRTRAAFIGGLLLFLVGHLLMISTLLPAAGAPPPWLLLPLAAALWLLQRLWSRLGRLRPAVIAYLLALLGVLAAAAARDAALASAATQAALIGAGLFALSDAVLAWRRFVHDPPWGQAATLSTYYLGLLGLALSA